MNTEETLSPQDSLNLITQTIQRTKEGIKEYSFYFLLWGWLIAISSFSVFLIHQITSKQIFLPFPILATAGLITTIIYYQRRKSTKTQTYMTYFLSRLWAVLGLCFIAVVFVNVFQGGVPFTDTLLLGGIGTLVSGWVIKFKPLVIGGSLFIVSMVISIFIVDEHKVLLHGIIIVLGYLVPGYLLRQSKS